MMLHFTIKSYITMHNEDMYYFLIKFETHKLTDNCFDLSRQIFWGENPIVVPNLRCRSGPAHRCP